MDFFACILILVIYYIRPMEWIAFFEMFNFVTVTALVGIVAILYRERGLPALRRIFATPIDWMMAAFIYWIIYTSPDSGATWASIKPWVFFYLIISQTLINHERIRNFLIGWSAVLMVVVLLALGPEIGFDPMGNYELTYSVYKGRLALNNSMMNNPNSLGHHTAPLLLFLYFQLFWNRPIFTKEVALALLALPATCIYLTQSKGSYLTAFGAFVAGQCFGRPKYVQAVVLALAVTGGWAGIKLLPRMEQLEQPSREEGIGGRLSSFIYGLEVMNTHPNGVGWYRFIEHRQRETGVKLAAHSSYVECGADLGRFGLGLFLGVIYMCFRTLITTKSSDTDMERSRRILFCLILSYTVSSWMSDLLVRLYFFMIVATISAYHRVLKDLEALPSPTAASEVPSPMISNFPPPSFIAPAPLGMPVPMATGVVRADDPSAAAPAPAGRKLKTRPTIVDLALIWCLTEFWVWLWKYFIKNM